MLESYKLNITLYDFIFVSFVKSNVSMQLLGSNEKYFDFGIT